MKLRIQPTNRETFLSDDEFIISKTDTKGRITYGNKVLVDISCFQEHELLGKQHNIVRHPDMPRGIFHILWELIQAGKEYNGFVINLRKDGGFYWIFTNVTPSYDTSGKLIGYYSVRRKPKREALDIIKPIYQKMLEAEKQAGAKKAITASRAILDNILKDKGTTYDEFVCTLQH